MESWCFDSLDKGYVSNETVSPSDSTTRSEFKAASFSYENSLMVPSHPSVENPGFPEVCIAEMMKKQFPHDSVRNVFNSHATVRGIISPSVVNTNVISVDKESCSKLSSSVVDSNSRESSLIDLKLGGFSDNQNSNSPRSAPNLSSTESSTPAKRVRAMNLCFQTAYCQVYGCNKDLSSAKDYYKRHKVCDVHSKTAKVIVNGIEQRFCQQCSRFHLLAEFDDGKRSCRKRLAGHNERRRKPQVGFSSSRTARSLHSHTGSTDSKFHGTTFAAASFICPDILGPSSNEKYTPHGLGRHIKVEDGADSTQFTNTCIYEVQHKSAFPTYLLEKQYHPVMENVSSTGMGSVFNENANQYPHGIVSHSLFQTNSLGNEDLTLYDPASTAQGIPGISESGCALSLLSSQSQNSPRHSPGIPAATPLIISNSSSHYSMSDVSEKLFGVSSQSLTSGIEKRHPSYKVGSTGRNHLSAIPMLDNDDTANFDLASGILQASGFMNVKDCKSCDEGTTIDLFQLSSQLQRVETQRQSGIPKQENERFLLSWDDK